MIILTKKNINDKSVLVEKGYSSCTAFNDIRNSSYIYMCMKIYVVRVRLNILAITSQIIMFPFSMPAIKKNII